MKLELAIGNWVAWGSADYPEFGQIRYFTSDFRYAFIRDGKGNSQRVAVRLLRVIPCEVAG